MFAADGTESMSSICWYQCKPNFEFRLKWLKNKGAILVVIWSFLVASVFHYLTLSLQILGDNQANGASNGPSLAGIILIFLALLFPIGGWLADSYLGRHKMIRYSTWLMWVSIIAMTVWYILIKYVIGEQISHAANLVVNVVLNILLGIGLGGFQANVVQLGIDQLTEASSVEITSFITSYVFTLYTSGMVFHFIGSCKSTELSAALLMMLYVAVCLTLAVCVDFIFESSLVKESVPTATNSVTLIAKITKYAVKNRFRSLDDTDTMSSVFDVAKHNHGGPFGNQHVEHVKIFFRIMLVIILGTPLCGQISVLAYARGNLQQRFADWKNNSCYLQLTIQYGNYIAGAMIILLYELVVYPLLNKCIPTIRTTSVFLWGVFFCFLAILVFLGIEMGAFLEQSGHNDTREVSKSCLYVDDSYEGIQFSSLWMIAADSLEGLYTLLLILSGYKFMWSQAPSNMKGLVVGMMYAFLGLNAGLLSAISAPFLFVNLSWAHALLSCGIWYYLTQIIIVLIVGAVFVWIVKYYKKSQQTEIYLSSVSVDAGYNGDAEEPPYD